ncbi:MAG TPA: GAF domain-containing protein [Candidatus Polarisedimenticolia bacterium]|nr:GAF domain-containing protein [Candidatus Polarisedimenticolia bacterium]
MEEPNPPAGSRSPASPLVPLESVITTPELARRPARTPDYEAENVALASVMEMMATASGSRDADRILQKLADTALELCRAQSAGVSILEKENGREVFRWRAAAGVWKKYLGQCMPRHFSPCGTVLDRNIPLLMEYPERHYAYTDGAPPLAEVLLIPFYSDGKAAGTVWVIAHEPTRKFDAEDKRLMTRLSQFAAATYQLLIAQDLRVQLAAQRALEIRLEADLDRLRSAEAALRDAQDRLRAELADARLLQAISAELIVQDDVKALYEKLLDAAVTVMRSDFASLQRLDSEGGVPRLTLLAFRNFSPEAALFWKSVPAESGSPCGQALRAHTRIITADVEECEVGGKNLETMRQTGIRAVQSTPLLSRDGRLVGMISTQWRRPHWPTDRDLVLFDILARQAADLIERKEAEETLRELDRRKDAFLATLAHELRNPLAPVRNAIQIQRLSGPVTPQLQWTRDVIDRQIQQMSRLIDDLLDISRITHDKLDLRKEPVDLATVVQTAVESTRPFIEERGHELTVALPPGPIVVDADPTRLAQVLSNLLNNAGKYSGAEGRITLAVRHEEGGIVVSVRDQGIGIAPDMLPRVFDLFSQAEPSAERGRSGLGVGLTLVKRLVEMHGGSVAAFSKGLGEGAEFVVRMPVLSSTLPAPHENEETLAIAPGLRRILVVDDNEDSAASLGKMLGMLGYETHTVCDSRGGLDAAASFSPHVALLDLGMPEMDGYELARRIREQPWGKDPVLIAVTGWGQAEDKQRTTAAGFDHHLVKPVDPAALAKLLASLPARG